MQDNYANYVVQKLFEFGDENIKKRIYGFLKKCDLEVINGNNFSKHVYQSIEKSILKGIDGSGGGAGGAGNRVAGGKGEGHKNAKKKKNRKK